MVKNKFKIAFVADPLQNFNPTSETTSYFMQAFQKAGHDIYHITLPNLYLKDSEARALCQAIKISKTKNGFSFTAKPLKDIALNTMHAIFLRKDPPFDLNFLDHLSLLETLKDKCVLVNNPSSVKVANEKLFGLHFKNLMPRTLVSQNKDLLKNFIQKEKKVILKPLNLSGGQGIVQAQHNDPSLSSLLDILTKNSTQFIMAQQFLSEASKGDKRILFLDGEVLGAFLRVPGKSDFRGNLHSGAKMKKCTITKREKEIIKTIAPTFKSMGLHFVGIDIIGNYVTEINSTSPMGVHEINRLYSSQIEKIVVNWLHNKILNKS